VSVCLSRGSHIDVAWRSVCDLDQNVIKRSAFFLGAHQGIKTNSERLKSTITHFLRYLAGVGTFCPLNSRRIKGSRASEWSDQAIKRSRTIFTDHRFLIPLANASTGDVYVTTPCLCVCYALASATNALLKAKVRYQQKALDAGNKINVGIELKILSSKVMTVISLPWNLQLALTARNRHRQVSSVIRRKLLVRQALRLHL